MKTSKRAAGTFLVAAAVAYVLAAWTVAPGFYDGFGPTNQYRWTCPPPQAGANQAPLPGHLDLAVVNGQSQPSVAVTNDGQFAMDFLPGAFDATGRTTISIDITPTATCPHPSKIDLVTNTYSVTASAPLVSAADLSMTYSNLEPDPSKIYLAQGLDGPWTSLGATPQVAPYVIATRTTKLGYFAAGYPKPAGNQGPTVGGSILPVIVAALIVIVLLAGLPLAAARRRQGGSEEDDA